jgi:hypothetical protein
MTFRHAFPATSFLIRGFDRRDHRKRVEQQLHLLVAAALVSLASRMLMLWSIAVRLPYCNIAASSNIIFVLVQILLDGVRHLNNTEDHG